MEENEFIGGNGITLKPENLKFSSRAEDLFKYRTMVIKEMRKLIPLMAELSGNKIEVEILQGYYEIIVGNLKELRIVRSILRKQLINYSDKLISISPYYGDLGCAYYNIMENRVKNSYVSMMLVAKIGKFPVKVGKGCGFRKTIVSDNPSTRWEYVCHKTES